MQELKHRKMDLDERIAKVKKNSGKKSKKKPRKEEDHQTPKPTGPASPAPAKATRKERHRPDSGEDRYEHRNKLRPMPQPKRTKKHPCGTTLTRWEGEPWSIDGDSPIVVTKKYGRAINSAFGRELKVQVGKGYQEELWGTPGGTLGEHCTPRLVPSGSEEEGEAPTPDPSPSDRLQRSQGGRPNNQDCPSWISEGEIGLKTKNLRVGIVHAQKPSGNIRHRRGLEASCEG